MKKVVFAGLPDSGKSTFLAALCHQLLNGRAETVFKLERFSEEEGRLRALEAQWLAARRSERTKTNTESWVTIHVCRVDTGEPLSFEIPDLRGELFEHPAVLGSCEPRLWEALQTSEGIVLFTNGGRNRDDIGIEEISAAISHIGDPQLDDMPSSNPDTATVSSSTGFDPRLMPEEAKLVELLQSINRAKPTGKPRRLAVVVSAWDVCDAALRPSQWFSQERPMLDQFLSASTDNWRSRVYGVSAQGGRLPQEAQRLSKIRNPADRVRVATDEISGSDLTTILDWVSG